MAPIARLPVAETLEFYRKRYVDQLPKFRAVDAGTVVADIGTGSGWLAMAFAAYSPASLSHCRRDGRRAPCRRSPRIAEILGLADRITWLARRPARAGHARRPPDVDVAYCIEVLEQNVQRKPETVADLERLSARSLDHHHAEPVVPGDRARYPAAVLPLAAACPAASASTPGHSDATGHENDNLFWSPARSCPPTSAAQASGIGPPALRAARRLRGDLPLPPALCRRRLSAAGRAGEACLLQACRPPRAGVALCDAEPRHGLAPWRLTGPTRGGPTPLPSGAVDPPRRLGLQALRSSAGQHARRQQVVRDRVHQHRARRYRRRRAGSARDRGHHRDGGVAAGGVDRLGVVERQPGELQRLRQLEGCDLRRRRERERRPRRYRPWRARCCRRLPISDPARQRRCDASCSATRLRSAPTAPAHAAARRRRA